MHKRLLVRLQARQKRDGLSGAQMARGLGISNAYWSRLVAGKRDAGVDLLAGVVRAWPEYNLEVIEYLRTRGSGNGRS